MPKTSKKLRTAKTSTAPLSGVSHPTYAAPIPVATLSRPAMLPHSYASSHMVSAERGDMVPFSVTVPREKYTEIFAAVNNILNNRGKRDGEKESRITFTEEQIDALNNVFKEEAYPDAKRRNALARDLGIDPKKVRIWFQNERARAVKSGRPINTQRSQHIGRKRARESEYESD